MPQKKRLVSVEPLMAVVFWGYAFTGIAVALQAGFQPQAIVALRMGVAGLGFSALYVSGFVRFQKIPWKDWPRLLLLTATGIFAYHLALVNGQREVPAGIASLIVTSTAVWTYLISILLGSQKWNRNAGLGLILATAGMFVVVSQRSMTSTTYSWASVALVLCAPVSLALYTILAKPMLKYGAANLTGQVIVLAVIGLAGLQFVTGGWSFPTAIDGWVAILLTGLLSTLISYTLWFRALETLEPTTVAAYSYLTPVFGNLFAVVLLGEAITWNLVTGAVAIFVGLVLIVRATNR
jgi:drug/metabolite transporter (DMT)-like permease